METYYLCQLTMFRKTLRVINRRNHFWLEASTQCPGNNTGCCTIPGVLFHYFYVNGSLLEHVYLASFRVVQCCYPARKLCELSVNPKIHINWQNKQLAWTCPRTAKDYSVLETHLPSTSNPHTHQSSHNARYTMSKARDETSILTDIMSGFLTHWTTQGTPKSPFYNHQRNNLFGQNHHGGKAAGKQDIHMILCEFLINYTGEMYCDNSGLSRHHVNQGIRINTANNCAHQ